MKITKTENCTHYDINDKVSLVTVKHHVVPDAPRKHTPSLFIRPTHIAIDRDEAAKILLDHRHGC